MGLFRPKSTDIWAGEIRPDPTGKIYTRYYYHRIYDDGNNLIDMKGIPCQEIVHWRKPESKENKRKKTGVSDDVTKFWKDADGAWEGNGIALRDTLRCSIYNNQHMVLTMGRGIRNCWPADYNDLPAANLEGPPVSSEPVSFRINDTFSWYLACKNGIINSDSIIGFWGNNRERDEK